MIPGKGCRRTAALLGCIVLAACGGQREQLIPVRGPVPPGVDLSGFWYLESDHEDMERRIDEAIRRTDGVDERDILKGMIGADDTPSRRRRRNRNAGGLVHVFLESAARLRITQTASGLFVAFGRSVVEEYRFGEATMVQTGGAMAQRVSGWDGDGYVIETLDETGMKLTERYQLGGDGSELTRTIVLRSAELQTESIVQTFSRE